MSNKQKRQMGPGSGGPMGGLMRGGEKANNFKGSIKNLLKRFSRYYLAFVIVFIFATASTIFSIVGPKILGQATTELFIGIIAKSQGTGSINFEAIARIILFLAFLYGLSAIFSFIQGFIMSKVANNIAYDFRKDISQKINKLPIKFFDTTPYGEVLSRLTNDVDTLSQSLAQNLTQIITSIVSLIGITYMMITINVSMTLVTILVIPVSLILIAVVVKFSQKQFKLQQEMLGKVNGHIEEMYGGHIIVKAFNGEQSSIKEFNNYNNNLYKSAWKSQFLSGMMQPIMGFIGNIGYVIVCLQGGILAINGQISVGDIQAFIQYVRSFQQPITQTAQISNQLQSMAAAAERIFDFLQEPEEIADSFNALNIEDFTDSISFDDISFGYNTDDLVIKNFSAIIKPGQKVAIVGPTGAGKTTIVKLLMRFYDVNQGSIKIDNQDIRHYQKNPLRELFGMVLQDAWLFNGSIADNIRYSKTTATQQQVIDAAKAAHVDNFVKLMPNNYDFLLNEEANNVSAGQKQLLTIARAFLANPKILVLDEATSSVDTRTEQLIQSAMEQLMTNRTTFVIAHRLSTIRNADLILVMNHGNIVEQGNHQQLLKQNGFYAELYNSQFE